MNLLEVHIRAGIVRNIIAHGFVQLGFKTEGRLLKVQSGEVQSLINKALDEMPAVEPFEVVYSVLGGPLAAVSYHEKRRKRGKYYQRIGTAEKRMLKTLRKAFDSLYKENADWTRRKQIEATTIVMKGLMDVPKQKAKALLDAVPK